MPNFREILSWFKSLAAPVSNKNIKQSVRRGYTAAHTAARNVVSVAWWQSLILWETAILEIYNPHPTAQNAKKYDRRELILSSGSELTIGASGGCDISVYARPVSGSSQPHLRLFEREALKKYEVQDNGSQNGTYYKKYWWRKFTKLPPQQKHLLTHREILCLGLPRDKEAVKITFLCSAPIYIRFWRRIKSLFLFGWERVIPAILLSISLVILPSLLWLIFNWSSIPSEIAQASNPNQFLAYRSSQPEIIAPLTTSRVVVKSLTDFPQVLRDALLASEDATFFLDPFSALFKNQRFLGFSLRGVFRGLGGVGGGSTITQQLARNKHRTWVGFDEKAEQTDKLKQQIRKFKEIAVAIKIELTHKKEDILLTYMNSVYLGGENIGFAEAAKDYFQKDVNKIQLAESASLVAMLPSPECYNPNIEKPLDICKYKDAKDGSEQYETFSDLTRWRNIVLKRMVENGFIPQERKREGEKAIQTLFIPNSSNESDKNKFALSNTDYGLIYDELDKRFAKDVIRGGDLRIETTLDLDIQKYARTLLEEFVKTKGKEKNISQGAIVAMYAKTGEIRAIVTAVEPQKTYEHKLKKLVKDKDGKQTEEDVKDNNGNSIMVNDIYNYASNEELSPGSTFKIFPYLGAIRQGANPVDTIACSPFHWEGERFDWRLWEGDGNSICRSDNDRFNMYDGLANSDNTIALKVAQKAGFDEIESLAKGMGISTKVDRNPRVTLGLSQVKLLEMTAAYATLANQGQYRIPHTINKVYDVTGKCANAYKTDDVCELYDFKKEDQRFGKPAPITPDQAKSMTQLLQNVVTNGTAASVVKISNAAGKTGTSTEVKDLWFIGYTDDGFVVGVWLGNPLCSGKECKSRTRTFAGSGDAATIWNALVKKMGYPERS
jgi:penicillin-binding protein 1A